MSALWAVAGLWRFLDEPLGSAAAAAWAGFGVAALVYGVAVISGAVCGVLRLGR